MSTTTTRKRRAGRIPPEEAFAAEMVQAARRLRDVLISTGTHPFTLASLHALIADAEAEGLVLPVGEGEA
jgi:hypothetical protein